MKKERYLISSAEPLIAFVVPVHNQVEIIASNLDSLIDSIILPFEIVIINDGSDDGTDHELYLWCERILQNPPQNVCSIEILQTQRGRFETWCDKEGINRTSAPHVIEVQADMRIIDKGFDARLQKLMKSNPDMIAISGRGVEAFTDASSSFDNDIRNTPFKGLDFGLSFFLRLALQSTQQIAAKGVSLVREIMPARGNDALQQIREFACQDLSIEPGSQLEIFPDELSFQISKRAGRLGHLMEEDNPVPDHVLNKVWVGESIMRGPMIIDRSKYFEIGGFNTKVFFLGHDDHDLARRGWVTQGYRVGFHPVKFTSPLEHGSTRKQKSAAKKYVLAKKRAKMARRSRKSFLVSHADTFRFTVPKSEIRSIETNEPT